MDNVKSLFDLRDKVALVTGASSGLGRRAAIVLADAGAKVVGVARRRAALEDLRKEIGNLLDILLKKNSEIHSDLSNETPRDIEPATKAAS